MDWSDGGGNNNSQTYEFLEANTANTDKSNVRNKNNSNRASAGSSESVGEAAEGSRRTGFEERRSGRVGQGFDPRLPGASDEASGAETNEDST